MLIKLLNKEFIIQFIKYFWIGLLAAIINILSLYLLCSLFNINYIVANIMAFTLGLIINYLLSKKYVFINNKLNTMLEFIIYGIIGIIGLNIDTLFLWIFTDKLKIYYIISKIISTGITFIWNFIIRKILYFIIDFKESKK